MEPPEHKPPEQNNVRRRWWMGLLSVGALLGLGLAAPKLTADTQPSRLAPMPKGAEALRHRDGRITFSDAFAERAGLHTVHVEHREVVPTVRATGAVAFSPRNVAAVGSRIFGRVTEVEATLGQRVKRGQALARIESAELGKAHAELLSLEAQARLARAEHRRKKILVREGIASKRSSEISRSELEAVQARQRAAAKYIRSMGGSPGRNGNLGELVLRAPIDGEVVGVDVHRGQAIEPSHTAFEVADLSELWVELSVFERDLPLVAVGDRVEIQSNADAEVMVPGTVEHISSVLDPSTRTATIRVVVDNGAKNLRVGQSVTGRIEAHQVGVRGLAVPRKAVVLVDGTPTVFVLTAPREVEPRSVNLGLEGARDVEIVAGLEEGEQVIVEGVFALKSELFR